jgi:predicted NUDIX family phosphoesterase
MSEEHVFEEKVLCSLRSNLPETWLGDKAAIRIGWKSFMNMLTEGGMEWIVRSEAESNEAFKQWIPYALLVNEDGLLATYPRQGTETRLHGVWSLGVGGHVHPSDGLTWESALASGLEREIREEYHGVVLNEPLFLGVINEEISDLGRVHIGAVFIQRCQSHNVEHVGELCGLQWIDPAEIGNRIARSRFEIWSLLALELTSDLG